MDGWTDEWMDGWMDGWMDEWGSVCWGRFGGQTRKEETSNSCDKATRMPLFPSFVCFSDTALPVSFQYMCCECTCVCMCMQNKLPVSMTDSPQCKRCLCVEGKETAKS